MSIPYIPGQYGFKTISIDNEPLEPFCPYSYDTGPQYNVFDRKPCLRDCPKHKGYKCHRYIPLDEYKEKMKK